MCSKMMQKNYLKLLKSSCNKLKKENKEVLDIIIYGSFAKGKSDFSDIDLMLIFNNAPLKNRLEIALSLKTALKNEIGNADIKTMNLVDIFDGSFLARQALFIEGFSLIKNKPLAELIGFEGLSIFTYNLKNLNHNQKTQFIYALSGRNSEGVLKSLKGASLGRGAVKIPVEHSIEFEQFLQKWEINYKIKNVLESKL